VPTLLWKGDNHLSQVQGNRLDRYSRPVEVHPVRWQPGDPLPELPREGNGLIGATSAADDPGPQPGRVGPKCEAMPTILLVSEDHAALEPLVRKVATPIGWSLEPCSTVSGALQQLGTEPGRVSLILLDAKAADDGPVHLPDIEALTRSAPGVPVIVLAGVTADASQQLAVRCGRAGAWDFFLRDPLDETRLSTSLNSALTRSPGHIQTAMAPNPAPAASGREPALISFAPKEPGDEHACTFALRLRGVSGEAEGGGSREQLEQRQVDWARRLLGGMVPSAGDRLVELRYLASSGRDPAAKTMVSVHLVGIGLGADEDTAAAAARALWSDLESFARLGQDLYQFWPVESPEDLRLLLRPFEPRCLVEITASAGRLVVNPVTPGSVGFQGTIRTESGTVALGLPLLAASPSRPLRPLLEALAAQKTPLQLTLRLEPGALTSEERSLLETVRQQLSAGLPDSWTIEDPDGTALMPLGERGRAQDAVLGLLGGLGDHFRARFILNAPGTISRPLQTIAADVLVGGDARCWAFDTLGDHEIQPVRSEWGIRRGDAPLASWFHKLRPVSHAWVSFRLPLAGDGEVNGIDTVPLSYGYFPPDLPDSGTKVGEKRTPAGLYPVYQKDTDRLRHTYVLGQTGTGKSTLLATMAIQDMEEGRGLSVLDPHGDLIEDLLSAVPKSRLEDVVVFDLADIEHPVGLNLLEYDRTSPQQKTFLINEMMAIFDTLYDLRQAGGPMFENYMFNAMLLLMQDAEIEATLLHVPKVFIDGSFRKELLVRCGDELVKDFWKQALAAGGEAALANMAPYITSKLNQFVFNDVLRPVVSQPRSTIDFRAVMDDGKILFVNLARGYAGDMSSALVGMIVVAKLMAAALGRYNTPRDRRRTHFLYVDEFQNFTSRTVPQMLAEVRKYGLGLILANQNLQQLREATVQAVLGNVGTMLFFRPGPLDAERIRPYVEPTFSQADLLGLPNFAIVGRLLVEDAPRPPFLFNTAWRARTIDR